VETILGDFGRASRVLWQLYSARPPALAQDGHKHTHERRAHFSTEPPHPVPGCVLEVLVLLVTTLHQSGECVVVELIVAALFLPRKSVPVSRVAAAAIRAVFFAVVKDALANLRRIPLFFMWLSVFLDVALCTRCDAITSG